MLTWPRLKPGSRACSFPRPCLAGLETPVASTLRSKGSLGCFSLFVRILEYLTPLVSSQIRLCFSMVPPRKARGWQMGCPRRAWLTQRCTCCFSVVCRSASEIEVSNIGLFVCLLFLAGHLGPKRLSLRLPCLTPTIPQPSPTQPTATLEN